ncbi:zf-ZPR1-domain-containing protein [Suillus subalutaceus]|uniref:zf-ZPR1-domain-containing protein n=1 Tax=Suillus subalutaceus TaxID=48586 RepID=UPI001B886EBB|nr:zf-ZPR1-domain-containing protein [Suillus subalutaceus]KAG1834913.1 zf-ZPR1-domain-containing protein [Suillus subalutaceus]
MYLMVINERKSVLPNHVVDKTHAGDEDISARPLEEIESLCMQCGEQGVTRMMLTSISFFREVMAAKSHQLRPDLDRQLIRSEVCSINIPEFQLVLPPSRGQPKTVEGLLRDIVADLSVQQPLRRIQDENAYAKIADDEDEDQGKVKFEKREPSNEDPVRLAITITLDNPSGNSFLEFVGSMSDLEWNIHERSLEQNRHLGLAPPADDVEQNAADEVEQEPGGLNEEVSEFPGICSRCGRPLITRMKKVSIPYFKACIEGILNLHPWQPHQGTLIMSTNCDDCGYRDNVIKSGAAISEHGKKITLKVEDRDDLGRDILKSDEWSQRTRDRPRSSPRHTRGTLTLTTLEGILDQVYDQALWTLPKYYLALKKPDGEQSLNSNIGVTAFRIEGFEHIPHTRWSSSTVASKVFVSKSSTTCKEEGGEVDSLSTGNTFLWRWEAPVPDSKK